MLPAGFEPAMPAREKPQTHALDREATGIGTLAHKITLFWSVFCGGSWPSQGSSNGRMAESLVRTFVVSVYIVGTFF